MKIVGIITSRLTSKRFPNKPLALIKGKPLIKHIYDRVSECDILDKIYIDTPDCDLVKFAEGFDANVIMTRNDHRGCIESITESSSGLDADYIVLIQGDEPLVNCDIIKEVINTEVDCTNLLGDIGDDIHNRNIIKVIMDVNDNVLYMTRQPIKTPYKQLGIMGFKKESLKVYNDLEPSYYELSEMIDMNRFVTHGYKVKGIVTKHKTHSVDVPSDIGIVEDLLDELY